MDYRKKFLVEPGERVNLTPHIHENIRECPHDCRLAGLIPFGQKSPAHQFAEKADFPSRISAVM
jgi:hypothetical protein